MIDYEKLNELLLGYISTLQSEVNDLKWRMNEVCNTLSLKEKTGWNREQIFTEKPCDNVVTECQHDWSERIDRGEPFKDPYRWFVRCKKCYAEQYVCNILSCQHESAGVSFDSNPPQYKCIKCGEFYR